MSVYLAKDAEIELANFTSIPISVDFGMVKEKLEETTQNWNPSARKKRKLASVPSKMLGIGHIIYFPLKQLCG